MRLDLFCLCSHRQMSALPATKWKREKIMHIVQVEKLNALVALRWDKAWAKAAKFELACVSSPSHGSVRLFIKQDRGRVQQENLSAASGAQIVIFTNWILSWSKYAKYKVCFYSYTQCKMVKVTFTYTRRKRKMSLLKEDISGRVIPLQGVKGNEWTPVLAASITARQGNFCKLECFSYLPFFIPSPFIFLTVIYFWILAVFPVISKHLKLCFSVSILLFSLSAQ